jgi:peptidoglycan/xylan/chitin deacetylase (PgdA/CDA1 family)
MRTVYRSPTPVALTFDDGPDPNWIPLVLDALASIGARATFFVVALVRSYGLEPATVGELRHPLPDGNPDFKAGEAGSESVRGV